MLRFLRAAAAFLCASARNCRTCIGSIFCGLVVMIANQLDALTVPDVGDEWVVLTEASLQFFGREDSVVDLPANGLLCLAGLRGQLGLVGLAHDKQVDVAGSVGLVLGKRAEEPCRFDSVNRFECLF